MSRNGLEMILGFGTKIADRPESEGTAAGTRAKQLLRPQLESEMFVSADSSERRLPSEPSRATDQCAWKSQTTNGQPRVMLGSVGHLR
jgi:hypothetical protein